MKKGRENCVCFIGKRDCRLLSGILLIFQDRKLLQSLFGIAVGFEDLLILGSFQKRVPTVCLSCFDVSKVLVSLREKEVFGFGGLRPFPCSSSFT